MTASDKLLSSSSLVKTLANGEFITGKFIFEYAGILSLADILQLLDRGYTVSIGLVTPTPPTLVTIPNVEKRES